MLWLFLHNDQEYFLSSDDFLFEISDSDFLYIVFVSLFGQ